MNSVAWAGVALLLVMWLLGVMVGVGGPQINVLLLLAGVGIEHSCWPAAGRARNTGDLSRQGLSGSGRSEERVAA